MRLKMWILLAALLLPLLSYGEEKKNKEEFKQSGELIKQRREEHQQNAKKIKEKSKSLKKIKIKTWKMTLNGKLIHFDEEPPIDALQEWNTVLSRVDDIVNKGENLHIIYSSNGHPLASNSLWKLKRHLKTARRNPVITVENLPHPWAQEMVKSTE